MTSLSAIIFLSSAKWPHPHHADHERGGAGRHKSPPPRIRMSLIFVVLAAIGLMYAIVGRAFPVRKTWR